MSNIIEIVGESYSGKTKYALSLLDKNNIVLYIDADYKLNDNYKYNDKFIICKENNIDIIHYIIKELIEYVDVIVIDSLPMISSDNIKYDIYDYSIFNKIVSIILLCKHNECDLIIVNQFRTSSKGNRVPFGLKNMILYYTKILYIENNAIRIVKEKKERNPA